MQARAEGWGYRAQKGYWTIANAPIPLLVNKFQQLISSNRAWPDLYPPSYGSRRTTTWLPTTESTLRPIIHQPGGRPPCSRRRRAPRTYLLKDHKSHGIDQFNTHLLCRSIHYLLRETFASSFSTSTSTPQANW